MTPSEINKGLPEGATPFDPDEAEDLLPSHIRTRGELNVWEQENILVAAAWVQRTRAEALDESTMRELHRRMFSETWGWAGRFRTSDKTIGIHWTQIPVAVRNLVEDGRLWIRKEVFPPDEAAIRLHHRLTQIHPFPNGNGRHARLWCDMLLHQIGRPAINWGGSNLDSPGAQRKAYIQALWSADEGNLQPLLALFLEGRTH
jgi:Fic-DOC domain mobile mystery protein B